MKKITSLLFLLLMCVGSMAQTEETTMDDLLDSAQQWAAENLDPEVLDAFATADQEKIKKLFADLQKQMQGEYVIDLAQLKGAAQIILPLLEGNEETAPYAAWLKTQLAYLEVAEEFRVTIPPPKTEPNAPPKPRPNPTPQAERQIWIRKISPSSPWPPAAKELVPQLKPIFAAQKVPAELVWIAEVESGFNAKACSPVGARGLFQLMPATAKQYGLRVWPFDQRLRGEESARAAAGHLNYLHRKFKDWRLALAAYNAGEGTVQKLLDKSKAKTFDAIATRLPAETQMYVPRVEAVLLRREGKRLEEL